MTRTLTRPLGRRTQIERYGLMICTRHGWSPCRQNFPSRHLARQAGLWQLAQAGVLVVHVIDTRPTAGSPDVIYEFTKHRAKRHPRPQIATR